MVITAAFDLDTCQYDAVKTFLNNKLNGLIHCNPSKSYEHTVVKNSELSNYGL